MPKSTYASNTTLNSFLRNVPYTPPITVWLALFTTAPTVSGGGVEVLGNGYGRQMIAFTIPSNGSCSNTAAIVFPVAIVADWTTIVAFGVYDASSGGNLLYFANLSTSRYVAIGDQMVFPVGQLIATET